MSPLKKELRQLQAKRRYVTVWTLTLSFLGLLITSGSFGISLIFSVLFATIARMVVSAEIEEHNKILDPWRKR